MSISLSCYLWLQERRQIENRKRRIRMTTKMIKQKGRASMESSTDEEEEKVGARGDAGEDGHCRRSERLSVCASE